MNRRAFLAQTVGAALFPPTKAQTKHSYFSSNTAIVLRPEFGRDDEVNRSGQLHHSEGFYYTHRVASIFWGPDFNKGVDRTTVISRSDMAPTIAGVFRAKAVYAQGRIIRGLLY